MISVAGAMSSEEEEEEGGIAWSGMDFATPASDSRRAVENPLRSYPLLSTVPQV
jgi:hypothetical protein